MSRQQGIPRRREPLPRRNELPTCPYRPALGVPCIGTDGSDALSSRSCVGCGHRPSDLIADLYRMFRPVERNPGAVDSSGGADYYRRVFAELIEWRAKREDRR